MPALTLNGVTVPVALTSWERPEDVVLGGLGPGTSGRLESSIRKRKAPYRGRTPPLAAADALAFRGLVEGLGQSWTFDSHLYSARGLGPSYSIGCTVEAGGKYGSRLKIAGGSLLTYALPGSATAWTVVFWKRAQGTGTWEHFVVLGSGAKYKNGESTTEDPLVTYDGTTLSILSPGAFYNQGEPWIALNDYALNQYTLDADFLGVFQVTTDNGSSGASEPAWDYTFGNTTVDDDLVWTSRGTTTGYFDDLAYLPYQVPATWPPQLYAEAAARAWTAQPNVRANGDLVSPARLVQGRVTGAQPVAHHCAGTFERGGEALAVELVEGA